MAVTFLTNEDKTILDGQIAQLSEEIAAMKGGDDVEIITKSGVVVNIDAAEGAEITVRGSASDVVTLVHHGKNFVPFITSSGSKNGITYTVNDDGSVTIEGTATATAYFDFATVASPVYLPSGTYMLSGDLPMGLDVKVVLQNKDTGANVATIGYDTAQRAFTLSEGTCIKGYLHVTKGSVVSNTVNMQIERGASASGYEKCVRTLTNATLSTTVAALAGRNVLYTTTGDTLTASMVVEKTGDDGEEFKFNPHVWGLPVLAMDGDCNGMTKDDYVPLAFAFQDKDGNPISGTADVKKQGSSSINTGVEIGKDFDTDLGGLFNFTIKFPEAFEAKTGWTAQKKYCVKVNAIDHSHARNICSCKLWGEIVKSRANVPAELSSLVNGGAIDGFPIIIVLNGKFYALGTFNIPKEGWMFGSPKAILCADKHVDATKFKGLANLKEDFELEYVEDEDNADWVLPSLNRAIQAVLDSDGSNLDATVGQYIDIPSAIDYYIHTVDENADDGVDKNYILVTFDGVKWYFSAYDRDTVYGLYWNGKSFTSPGAGITYAYYANNHRLMYLIRNHKTADLKARAIALRNNIKSEINVCNVFTNFAAGIPAEVLAANCRRWPLLRSTNASNTAQILNWYRLRRQVIDKEIDAMT